METERKFYVYVDYREDDGKPFYVGKGTERRVKLEKRNPLHTNIKKKHGMVRKILFDNLSESESFEKEIQLIQELRTHIDFREGGANLTMGGEGISGYKFTKEQRKKLWDNPEHREKMRESLKKTWDNPEHRENISKSMEKTWQDLEHRLKVSNQIRDHHGNPEFRRKQGEKMREVLSNPEIRKKISEITKEKLSDPEIRGKISENVKLSLAKLTPEQRSERIKLGWETRRLKKLQQNFNEITGFHDTLVQNAEFIV